MLMFTPFEGGGGGVEKVYALYTLKILCTPFMGGWGGGSEKVYILYTL